MRTLVTEMTAVAAHFGFGARLRWWGCANFTERALAESSLNLKIFVEDTLLYVIFDPEEQDISLQKMNIYNSHYLTMMIDRHFRMRSIVVLILEDA